MVNQGRGVTTNTCDGQSAYAIKIVMTIMEATAAEQTTLIKACFA